MTARRLAGALLGLSLAVPGGAGPTAPATAAESAPVAPTGSTPQAAAGVATLRKTGDAFYAAVKATKRSYFAMAPSATVRKVLNDWGRYIELGNTSAITDAWSGMAVDWSTGWGYITGGGHYDTGFNGVVAINLRTGEGRLFIEPSIITPAQLQKVKDSWAAHGGWLGFSMMGEWPNTSPPDGKRESIHTYQMLAVLAGKLLLKDHFWDLKTKETGNIAVLGAPNANGAHWGPNRYVGTSWAGKYWDVTVIDMATRSASIEFLRRGYVPDEGGNINFDDRTYVVVLDDRLYCLKTTSNGNPAFAPPLSWYVPLPMKAADNFVVTTGKLKNRLTAADFAGLQRNTQALDPRTNALVIPSQDWSYYVWWKPLTGETGKIVVDGGRPSAKPNAAYGRFAWNPVDQVFNIVNGVDDPVVAIDLGTI